METTYAPSGDENVQRMICSFPSGETTYAPSGDENCSFPAGRLTRRSKQLAPRQGTKTRHSAGLSLQSQALRNNLRPARGRKKLLTHVDKEQKEVDTYETYFI